MTDHRYDPTRQDRNVTWNNANNQNICIVFFLECYQYWCFQYVLLLQAIQHAIYQNVILNFGRYNMRDIVNNLMALEIILLFAEF